MAAAGLLFALTLAIQFGAGSWTSELGGYADEPPHYVTGLMFTEYVRQGFPGSPLAFAKDYYLHYPKVAIGSWPPAFYILQTLWTLPFGSSKLSVFVLVAAINAGVALLIYGMSWRRLGRWSAAMLAAAYLLLPVTQDATSQMMADALVTLCTTAAVWWFAKYWDSSRYRDAALYGLAVSATVLTKGSGVALTAIPVLMIVATRRWRQALHGPLLAAAVIAALLGGPWTYFTLSIVQDGWQGEMSFWSYLVDGLWRTPSYFAQNLTWLPGGVLLASIGWLTFKRRWTALPLTCLMTVAAVLGFHVLTPVGLEPRRLLMGVPAAFVLAGYGLEGALGRLPRNWAFAPATLLAAVVAVMFLPPVEKPRYGFDRAAEYLLREPSLQGCAVLVSSSVDAEGMLIAEVAMRRHRPERYMLRATKLLANMTWAGAGYQTKYETSAEVQQYLDASGIRVLAIGPFPGYPAPLAHTLKLLAVAESKAYWDEVASFGKTEGSAEKLGGKKSLIRLFRRKDLPCPAKPEFDIDLGNKVPLSLKVREH